MCWGSKKASGRLVAVQAARKFPDRPYRPSLVCEAWTDSKSKVKETVFFLHLIRNDLGQLCSHVFKQMVVCTVREVQPRLHC